MKEIKTREYLFLHNDLMFKNTFGTEENKELTIDMLEKLFKLKKGSLKNSTIENSVVLDKKTIEEKKFEMDIVVKTENGDIINIEMQNRLDKSSEIKNFMYVTGIFSSQLRRGNKYKDINKIVQVEFSKDRQIHKNNEAISKYCMCNVNNLRDKMLEDEFYVIKVDLDIEGIEEDAFELWRRFMGSSDERELEELAKSEPMLRKAKEAMEKFMNNEYVQDYSVREKLIESRMEEAEERGYTKGIEKSLYEIAKKMLRNNKSIEEIMMYTDLTEEKIKKIIEEN